jgi:general secretion pathway protein D
VTHPLARAAALALALTAAAPVTHAAAQPPPAAAGTRINFVDARLGDVIRALAAMIGVNVVVGDVPDRRVTLQTAAPVRPEDLGEVFESLLEQHGLVLLRQGAVSQVIAADSAPAASPVGVGLELPTPPPLGLVTQLVPLEAIRADEGADALRQVASRTARIEVVARQNALLITDRGANVARYLDLLRRLDARPQGEAGLRTYVVPLKYANAEDLAVALGQLFGVSTGAARGASIADRGLSRALESFRERELDAFRQRQMVPPPTVPTPRGSTVTPSGGAPTGALPAAARDSATGPAAPGALVGQTTVVANAPTNALIIRTLPPNFPVLRETIEALDVRPAQVLLGVTVAEVTLGRGLEFGIDWEAVGRQSGATRVQVGRAVPDTVPSGPGLIIRKVFSFDDVDVRALLRTVASVTRVNVLSTPEVLAANNREARILVGSKVPFIAAQRLANDVALDRAVQYQDVGTALTIVPTINEDGYVTVQVLQEVSALTTQTLPNAFNAPVISTREAATRAVVRDGQTVVIAGLIGDTRERIESGVPLLKDIPLLGHLFKSTSITNNRTELAIFVTPYVIRTDADADRLRDRARDRLDPSVRGRVP